jgi:hypothetical protein
VEEFEYGRKTPFNNNLLIARDEEIEVNARKEFYENLDTDTKTIEFGKKICNNYNSID